MIIHMILYNTLIGVCAGAGLIITAQTLRRLRTLYFSDSISDKNEIADLHGHGVAMLIVGAPLLFFASALTLTWPLNVNPPINIAFGEPNVLLGMMLVVAGVILTRRNLTVNMAPGLFVVAVVGVMLLFISSAIFSYNLVGDAPPQEPITGQFTGWENTTFGVAYAVAGLGCVLAPFVMRHTWAMRAVYVLFTLSGVFFLIFSLLNYRTHIGLLINLSREGANYRW